MGHGATEHSDEDEACARYIAARLAGAPTNAAAAIAALWTDEKRDWPDWFPRRDAELACQVDRFDFALPVTRESGLLVARPLRSA